MPFAPKSICARCRKAGCDCRAKARKEQQRTLDERRGSPSSRGYGTDWQRVRLAVLSESPLCMDCAAVGLVRPAQEVHHIAKVSDRPDLRLDMENLMPLCKACHSKRTAKGE